MASPAPHSVVLPWDERLVGYDFGASHPLNPVRVELTIALARALGVLDLPTVTVVPVEPATDGELELVHTSRYLDAVRRAGETLEPDLPHGLGTSDDPIFASMHEASAL